MLRKWTSLICVMVVVGLAGYSIGQEKEKITCKGKVVDSQGQPVSGAKVSLYKLTVYMDTMSFDAELAEATDTNDEGAFSFDTAAESNDVSDQSIILIEKEGLALGWVNWYLRRSLDAMITLGAPEVLAGKVVDESGEPVSDAEVNISVMLIAAEDEPRYTAGKISEQLFTRKTDEAGKFRFERIPSEAAAEFIVKKVGLATVSTLEGEAMEQMQLQFKAGRTDIEIKLLAEAKIEGTVVEKQTGKPVSGVKLMVFQGQKQPFTGLEPVTSGRDGTFTIEALGPGKHIVKTMPNKETCNDWVASTIEVNVEAGKTISDVKLELSKGGLVEIAVTEEDANTPIEGANIGILNTVSREQSSEVTDANGIVRKRLAPGEYKITRVYKQDYPFERKEETFTVEDGKTSRVEIELKGYPKVTGTIRDEKGAPVLGAIIYALPSFAEQATTDSEGAFIIRLKSPSMVASRSSEESAYILAQHIERNLAAAVQIDEKVDNLEIKLTPGVIFSGKVVDINDKGIPDVQITLTFWASDYGYGIKVPTEVDSEGNFKISAIPIGYKYSVNASSDGYGQRYVQAHTSEAESNRMELEPLVLNLANLSASGIVVDELEKPVSNIRIYAYGNGQKDQEAYTDDQGKFTLENVCEGPIHIQANKEKPNRLHGSVKAEGGATDIKIVVKELDSSGRPVPIHPPTLVGKPFPGFDGITIKLSKNLTMDKRLLVCFFDMQQRPSRNCIMQLNKRAQELQEKDVIIVAIQASKIDENALNKWIKEQNISFPAGMIEANPSTTLGTGEEKTRFNWGLRSLPWLILTDKEYVVTAEGFMISELDEKLK